MTMKFLYTVAVFLVTNFNLISWENGTILQGGGLYEQVIFLEKKVTMKVHL